MFGFQFGQVFEFPVEAPGQARHRNIELVDVLVGGFGFDLDDQRILPLPSTCAAHRNTVEGDAFVLDGFHEVHEGGRAHDRDGLALVAAEIHAA